MFLLGKYSHLVFLYLTTLKNQQYGKNRLQKRKTPQKVVKLQMYN